jgi:tetratricopeptide (TPR) repeat protein
LLRLAFLRRMLLALVVIIEPTTPQTVTPEVQARIVPIFERARAAERVHDFETAAALYDQVLKLAPGVAEVWTNKGLVMVELGHHRDALAAFEKARSLKPELVVPHVFAGTEMVQLGRPSEAIPVLQKALQLEPGNPKARYELARAFIATQSYEQSIALLSTLNGESAQFLLGLSYLKWSRAAAMQLVSGNSPYGALLKADAAAVAGFPEAAAAAYHEAMDRLTPMEREQMPLHQETFRIQMSGSQPLKTFSQTSADPAHLWKSGKYDQALNAAKMRLKRGPDSRSLFWLSLSCRALARETLIRAVEEHPDSARTHLILAEMARDENDQERATAEFEKAVSADASNPEVWLLYVRHLAMIRNQDLLSNSRVAAEKFPNHVAIQCEFGNALLKAQQAKDALKVFRAVVTADPKLTVAHAGLADAEAALGNLDAAIAEMRQALPADSDGNYHYRIGRWYQQNGRTEEARAAFAETALIKAKLLEKVQLNIPDPPSR